MRCEKKNPGWVKHLDSVLEVVHRLRIANFHATKFFTGERNGGRMRLFNLGAMLVDSSGNSSTRLFVDFGAYFDDYFRRWKKISATLSY